MPVALSRNVTPLGSDPVSVSAGVGRPDVVTAKSPAEPAVNHAAVPLVIVGAKAALAGQVIEEVTAGLIPAGTLVHPVCSPA